MLWPGEDLGRGVGHVDGALDAVTKAEGLGEFDREAVGREVRFGVAKIFDDRAAVMAFDLGLDELHDLRGAEVHALFGRGTVSGVRRRHGGHEGRLSEKGMGVTPKERGVTAS